MSQWEPLTREATLAEVALTLVDMASPDDCDIEAWSECLSEAWPPHTETLPRRTAWAIVTRLTRSGAVIARAHTLRSGRPGGAP